MPRQGEAPNRRSQAHLVLLRTGGVPLPTGASLRSLVRGNAHAGFWSRGGQSDLSIDCKDVTQKNISNFASLTALYTLGSIV